jgi:hypothetical protein
MKPKLGFAGVVAAVMTIGSNMQAADTTHHHSNAAHSLEVSEFSIPHSLAVEHQHLHQALEALASKKAPVGPAAQRLADALEPHFQKENAEALPVLGLLAALSRGEISEKMRPAIEASQKLKSVLPVMLAEHKVIGEAIDNLRKAGEKAGDRDATKFAEDLALHAKTEEDVLYPAAILVGSYIETQLHTPTPKKK